LLSLLGHWDRALTQLNVAADLDTSTLAMAQTYREALRCESLRSEVFAGKRTPLLFGEPEQWFADLLEAHRLCAEQKYEASEEARARAFEAAPTISGMIDESPFSWIADADVRLGPVLEAIVNGRYYWLPFHRLKTIRIEAPIDLRDQIWMPAYLTLANGGEIVALIPTRYPGSELSEDAAVRMGRKTVWIQKKDDLYLGEGQRLLTTDQGDYPIMDIRKIELNSVDS